MNNLTAKREALIAKLASLTVDEKRVKKRVLAQLGKLNKQLSGEAALAPIRKRHKHTDFDYFYNAALVVGKWLQNEGGLKSLIFHSSTKTPMRVLAMAVETLKYLRVVDSLIASVPVLAQHFEEFPDLLNVRRVVVYNFLFGSGIVPPDEQAWFNSCVATLRCALDDQLTHAGVTSYTELIPPYLRMNRNSPRYVRVNTLLTTPEAAQRTLEAEGYVFHAPNRNNSNFTASHVFAEDDAEIMYFTFFPCHFWFFSFPVHSLHLASPL
jgi:hypothetical protein